MESSSFRIAWRTCFLAILISVAAAVAAAQLVVPGVTTPADASHANPALGSFRGDLPGSTKWKDTGLDLNAGDSAEITATGQLQYRDAKQPAGPDGLSLGWKDLLRGLPFSEAGRGALLARIGDPETSRVFLVGAKHQFRSPVAGRLYLGINQKSDDTGDGSFHVEATILERAAPAEGPARAASATAGPSFGAVFCSVLEREHPDAGSWGPCANYLESPPDARITLGAIPRTYRLAIVSGVLSACGGNSTAFREGREHLSRVHGITVDLIPAPNGSSAANGKSIAQFLRANYRPGGPKFILLGYSKGAADILEGLANDPQAAQSVAALITVAGAIGGSPIADFMPAQAQQWIEKFSLGECKGDLYAAFRSLRRDVRRRFLAQHPDAGFPVYSVAAASDRAHTSKALLEGWELLALYGQPEDSQLLESDTRYPGGHNLGVVHADHLAVAIPLEGSKDPVVERLVNHNHFPRTALLEALLRYVTHDLAAADASHASRLQ